MLVEEGYDIDDLPNDFSESIYRRTRMYTQNDTKQLQFKSSIDAIDKFRTLNVSDKLLFARQWVPRFTQTQLQKFILTCIFNKDEDGLSICLETLKQLRKYADDNEGNITDVEGKFNKLTIV